MFSEVRKVVEGAQHDLQIQFDRLQLKRRHSAINPDEFLIQVKKQADAFLKELNNLGVKQADVHQDDPIRAQLDRLLEGRVGPGPADQQMLDDICKDAAARYTLRRPPGYMDDYKTTDKAAKEPTYWIGGLHYQAQYGDYILWRQILDQVASAKLRAIVLVTDDEKEDWWQIIESKGPRYIGARPELVAEIKGAGAELFHLYNTERFLEFAKKYIGTHVKL